MPKKISPLILILVLVMGFFVVRWLIPSSKTPSFQVIIPTPTPVTNNPVILVHGLCIIISFSQCEASLNGISDYLKKQGFTVYIAPLPAGNDNIVDAEFLKTYINDILAKTGKQKVNLVGHSMGPFAMMYYVNYLGGQDKLASFVSLDSGRTGVRLACSVGVSLGGQLCPNSELFKKIFAGNNTPGTFAYVQIRAQKTLDSMSALEIESDKYNGGEYWISVPGDHFSVLSDPAVFKLIQQSISGNPPGTFVDKPIQ